MKTIDYIQLSPNSLTYEYYINLDISNEIQTRISGTASETPFDMTIELTIQDGSDFLFKDSTRNSSSQKSINMASFSFPYQIELIGSGVLKARSFAINFTFIAPNNTMYGVIYVKRLK